MLLTIDLEVAKETSYLAAAVYSVLQDLTKGGTPIEGFSYVVTSAPEITRILNTHSVSQIKRSIVELEKKGYVRRIRLTSQTQGVLHGTAIHESVQEHD